MNAKKTTWFEDWVERVKAAMLNNMSNATPEKTREYDDRVEERLARGTVWTGSEH